MPNPGLCLAATVLPALAAAAPAQTVAHWRFQTGTIGAVATAPIADVSGNGHDAIPIGGPAFAAGAGPCAGTTLSFDGVDDRLFIPDAADLAITDSLTVEAILTIDRINTSCCGQNQILMRGDDRTAHDPYFLAIDTQGRAFFSFDDPSNVRTTVMTPAALSLGVQHHLAVTLENASGQLSIFVDGALVSSLVTTRRPLGALSGANPGIGIGNVQSTAYAQYLAGSIDEVRITHGALSPSQFLPAACYANCDCSSIAPVLNVNDFVCFLNRFSAGDTYANCDASTVLPVLNVNDFNCFLNRFAAGCP